MDKIPAVVGCELTSRLKHVLCGTSPLSELKNFARSHFECPFETNDIASIQQRLRSSDPNPCDGIVLINPDLEDMNVAEELLPLFIGNQYLLENDDFGYLPTIIVWNDTQEEFIRKLTETLGEGWNILDWEHELTFTMDYAMERTMATVYSNTVFTQIVENQRLTTWPSFMMISADMEKANVETQIADGMQSYARHWLFQ